MIDIERLYNISPHVRCIREEELCLYGTWMDYDHVFTYIQRGEVDFIINGISYHLNEGDAIIVPPYTQHLVFSRQDTRITHYVTHFDLFYDEMRAALHLIGVDESSPPLPEREKLLGAVPLVATLDRNEQIHAKIQLAVLMGGSSKEDPLTELSTKIAMLELLLLILRRQSKDVSIQEHACWPMINKAIEYISLHYGNEKLTNSMIADHVGLSENYLCSTFSKVLSISPHTYLVRIRISRAQELILNGKHTMTQVAAMTGFGSLHAFSRAFKNATGRSPKAFAKHPVLRLDE